MSTRCTINFNYGKEIVAKVYRHSDGYPDTANGVLADLKKFFAAVKKQTADTRFGDPSYLSAKFVVWQADQTARHLVVDPKKPNDYKWKKSKKLDFLGVGIMLTDPGDIEFTYFVDCSKLDQKGLPTVTWKKASRY